MRTGRYAGLVAGVILLQGLSALAGESAYLRGLKAPSGAFDMEALAYGRVVSTTGLKGNGDEMLPIFAPRVFYSGGTFQGRRITTREHDFTLGLHRAAGQNIAALSDPGIHSLLDTLPRYTLYSHVMRALPGGWGLGFGVRQTEYGFATANLLSLSAERSLGNFRGTYTLYSNRAEGTELGSAHRLEVSYLYGERNTIGLAYTTGRDIDQVALPASLSVSDARDWTLSGRHWLSPNWALTYDLLSQDQGPLYRRQGLRLGVSRSF